MKMHQQNFSDHISVIAPSSRTLNKPIAISYVIPMELFFGDKLISYAIQPASLPPMYIILARS